MVKALTAAPPGWFVKVKTAKVNDQGDAWSETEGYPIAAFAVIEYRSNGTLLTEQRIVPVIAFKGKLCPVTQHSPDYRVEPPR